MTTLKQQLQKKAIRFADLVIETNQKHGRSWNCVAAKMENQLWIKVEDAAKIELQNRIEWLKQKRRSYKIRWNVVYDIIEKEYDELIAELEGSVVSHLNVSTPEEEMKKTPTRKDLERIERAKAILVREQKKETP